MNFIMFPIVSMLLLSLITWFLVTFYESQLWVSDSLRDDDQCLSRSLWSETDSTSVETGATKLCLKHYETGIQLVQHKWKLWNGHEKAKNHTNLRPSFKKICQQKSCKAKNISWRDFHSSECLAVLQLQLSTRCQCLAHLQLPAEAQGLSWAAPGLQTKELEKQTENKRKSLFWVGFFHFFSVFFSFVHYFFQIREDTLVCWRWKKWVCSDRRNPPVQFLSSFGNFSIMKLCLWDPMGSHKYDNHLESKFAFRSVKQLGNVQKEGFSRKKTSKIIGFFHLGQKENILDSVLFKLFHHVFAAKARQGIAGCRDHFHGFSCQTIFQWFSSSAFLKQIKLRSPSLPTHNSLKKLLNCLTWCDRTGAVRLVWSKWTLHQTAPSQWRAPQITRHNPSQAPKPSTN